MYMYYIDVLTDKITIKVLQHRIATGVTTVKAIGENQFGFNCEGNRHTRSNYF